MKIKKSQLLPNVITAFGLCCGLFAIFKINMTPVGHVSHNTLVLTTLVLILAAFADLLDGAIARAMKAESDFGGLFDSMADAITFGVAPSVIVLKSLSIEPGTELSFLLTTAAIVYSVCGVLRLVRFNLLKQASEENSELKEAHNKNFTGLPIPAAAAAAISGNFFLASDELNSVLNLSHEARAWILFFQMILLGYLMISRWKFPSFKALQIRVKSFQQVFLTVVFTVFLIFYGIMQHFSVVFVIFSWGYIIVAFFLSLIRVISGRKSKTLEDFEPAPDDIEDDIEK